MHRKCDFSTICYIYGYRVWTESDLITEFEEILQLLSV